MKTAALILLALVSTSNNARADVGQRTEIGIGRVFIPPHGYDDNDSVVATIEVHLPDPCYLLREPKVSRRARDGAFEIRAYATRRMDGVCSTGDLLGPSNETLDVSLGELAAGDYRILNWSEEGKEASTVFHVEPARVATLDNFSYASITDASMDDGLSWDSRPVLLTLNGFTNSKCLELTDRVEVIRDGNVVIILPILSNRGGAVGCIDSGSKVPVQKEINLGQLPAGKYLIHVRSRHGKSVNRVLDVFPWPPKPKDLGGDPLVN